MCTYMCAQLHACVNGQLFQWRSIADSIVKPHLIHFFNWFSIMTKRQATTTTTTF